MERSQPPLSIGARISLRHFKATGKRIFIARVTTLEAAKARKKPISAYTFDKRLAVAEEEWEEAKADHLVAEWLHANAQVGARDAELELQRLLIEGLRAALREKEKCKI